MAELDTRKGYTLTLTLTADELSSAMGTIAPDFGLGASNEQFPDTLLLRCDDPENLKMTLKDPATGKDLGSGDVSDLTFRFTGVRLDLTPEGLACFGRLPHPLIIALGGIDQWKAWYTPDRTLEDLRKPTRRRRPVDAAKLLPLDKGLRLWTQTNLTGMVLDVATAKAEAWQHIPRMDGFALETKHGKALIENIGDSWDTLRRILDMLGPEGLQYTLATLAHIEDVTHRKFGELPEAYTSLNPIKIVASQLLRSMGRKSDGNTFSRDQQMRPRRFLKAQSMVDYLDIEPTKDGRTKLRIGPIINILNTELETCLPFDDVPDAGEVVSITVLPGEAVYQLMRKGIRWCHPKLLCYHPLKRKYEIAIGFYLGQLAVNRRNKNGQDCVSFGSIERSSGVESFDSNDSRRLTRIEEALDRLAEDGIIPGKRSASGDVKAIYQETATDRDPIERMREKKVKTIHPKALPNGYTPLPLQSGPQ